MAEICVLGSGGWGTALALVCCNCGHSVTLWSAFPQEIEEIEKYHENRKLLPGVILPDAIICTSSLDTVSKADLIILAVPSFAMRETCKKLAGHIRPNAIIVNVAKGLELGSYKRLSQVIEEELPQCQIVTLSGPSHAEEVARGVPTMVVAASLSESAARYVQDAMMNTNLRIYTNNDIIGVEIGGALKNIIALAGGICDGLKLGHNAKAALMTRGIAEISRLGMALGASQQTFLGLSGIGDLIVTCDSMDSRNRRFGIFIGEGHSTEEAQRLVGMTVEGYNATKAAYELAQKLGVDMPIVNQTYKVLYEHEDPLDGVRKLMERPKKSEPQTLQQ